MDIGVVSSIVLVVLYGGLTLWLSIVGMRKTTSLRSFAVGGGDMPPWLVGITMSSSIASTATFVVNPGFVWKDGVSAWIHYGVSATLGLALALVLLSKGFFLIGSKTSAVTLPDWIRKRFGAQRLGLFFAVLSLFYLTFIVLILSASARIVGELFGIGYHTALVANLLFVFSYVLMGGTYAHAYTNALQGGLMVVIATIVFLSGFRYVDGQALDTLRAVSPGFLSAINPDSALYNDLFSVFGASFVITFALMLQPHILTKVLYLRRAEDMNKFLVVAIGTSIVFSLMLFVGFFARLAHIEVAAQDSVVLTYIGQTFPPLLRSLVLVTLLAAGMSTLDGILVAISTVVVSDLVVTPLVARHPERGDEFVKKGLAWSRYVLVAIGLAALALSWNPPALLGLFAQKGIYGLVAASAAPILVGIFRPEETRAGLVGGLAVLGLAIHVVLHFGFGVVNPAVSAGLAILVSVGIGLFSSSRAQKTVAVTL